MDRQAWWAAVHGVTKSQARLNEQKQKIFKKRWQKYTEELYKKDLHEPDNHDGVITNQEPDILES